MKRILAAVALTFMVSSAPLRRSGPFISFRMCGVRSVLDLVECGGAVDMQTASRYCNISFSNGDFAIQKEAFKRRHRLRTGRDCRHLGAAGTLDAGSSARSEKRHPGCFLQQ